MDSETERKIEETVLEILRSSNVDETTEFMIRKSASEKLGFDLSDPTRKKFVRQIVNSYLTELNAKAAAAAEQQQQQNDDAEEEEEEEEEEEDHDKKKRKSEEDKEYDDEGDLIICRLSKSRRVTMTEFRGRTLVSIREYYSKEGKELPTSKGISLTAEQWTSFSKNVPAIEKAIKKMKSRLNLHCSQKEHRAISRLSSGLVLVWLLVVVDFVLLFLCHLDPLIFFIVFLF